MDDIQIRALAIQCGILDKGTARNNIASVPADVLFYAEKYIDYIKTGDKSQFKSGK